MKKRMGFVSNSSTASFVCEVCGLVESGWEMSLREAGMYECKNGHYFCKDHVLFPEIVEHFLNDPPDVTAPEAPLPEWLMELKKNGDDISVYNDPDYDYISDDVLPEKFCPICNLEHISRNTLLDYAEKKYNFKEKELINEIKLKFSKLTELDGYINK
jgi:hypothetical protein